MSEDAPRPKPKFGVAMVGFQLPMLPAHKMRAPSVDDQTDSEPPPPPPESSEQALPTVDEQPQQQPQQQRVQPPQLPTSAAGGPPPMRAGPPPLPRGAGPPPLPQGQPPAPQHDVTAAAAPSSAQRAASPARSQPPPQPRDVSPQRVQPPPQPKPTSPPTLPQQAHRAPPPMPTGPAPIAAAASAPAPAPAAASAPVVSAAIAAPPSLPPPQTAEESEVARSMLTFLLEELSPSVFTRKKEALDTFDQYYFKIRPTFTPEQVRSLLYGCTPAAPNELHKGLLALCGFTSWKSKKLKKAAGRAIAMLAKLCDINANPHAQAFMQPFVNSDITVIKMLRLGKHLSTSRGDRAGATFLLSLLKNFNARLYDATQAELAGSLSAEDDAALKRLRNDALARRISLRHSDKDILKKKAAYGAEGGSAAPGAPVPASSAPASAAAPAPVDPKAEKQTIKSRLKAFFSARPSAAELERRGLIRSKSFGVALEELSKNATLMESHESALDGLVTVPAVLATCCSFMERAGLIALQGVFRLSGDSLEIGATRDRLDLGAAVDLAKVGPHSVSGLVKLFLRSLPEPLLRFDHYDQLVAAFRADQMGQIDATIGRLPPAHRHTLIFLLDFLSRVNSHCSVNMMTDTNLAICIAPNILRPRVETYEKVAKDTPITIGVVRYLISSHAARMAQQGLLPAAPAAAPSASAGPADMPGGPMPAAAAAAASSAAASPITSAVASRATSPLPASASSPPLSPRVRPASSAELGGASAEAVAAAAASQAQLDADGNPVEPKPFAPTAAQFDLANAMQDAVANRSALKSRGPPPLGAAGAASPQRPTPPSGAAPPPLHLKPTPVRSEAPATSSIPEQTVPASSASAAPLSANVPPVVATPPPMRKTPSRESSQVIPEHFERFKDPTSGKFYYFNKLTGKVTWRRPDLLSDALDASDPQQLFPPTPPAEAPPADEAAGAGVAGEVSEPIRAPLPKAADESGSTGGVGDIDLPSILPAPPKQPRRTSRMLSATGGGPGLLPPPPMPVNPAYIRPDDSSDDDDDDGDDAKQGSEAAAAPAALSAPQPPPVPTTPPPPFDDDDDIPIDFLPPPPVAGTPTSAPAAAAAPAAEVPAAAAASFAPMDDPDLPPPPATMPPPLPAAAAAPEPAAAAIPEPAPAAALPPVAAAPAFPAKEPSITARVPEPAAVSAAATVDDDELDVEEDEEWDEFTDAVSGKAYFFNKRTNVTTWTNPFTNASAAAASPRSAAAAAAAAGAGDAVSDTAVAEAARSSQSGPAIPATYSHSSSAHPSPLYGGWSAVSIRGRWDGASAAGCFPNFPSWFRNPQFRLGVDRDAAAAGQKVQVVVQLQWERLTRADVASASDNGSAGGAGSAGEHNIAGFYVLRNSGPAPQKLYIHADEVVARSEFESAGSVVANMMLEADLAADRDDDDAPASLDDDAAAAVRPGYVVIPSSFEPGYVGDFTLTVHSALPSWIRPVDPATCWVEHSLQSQWLGDTAGGCRNHVSTFPLNPQFQLTSSLSDRPTPVLCLLSQQAQAQAQGGAVAASSTPHAIGWYAINSLGKIEAKGPFQSNLEVHAAFAVQPAASPYVLVPCTFAPGLEGNFTISVFAPPAAEVSLTHLQRA